MTTNSPPAGYYPDPSAPGYVRYWDGQQWVAGTSRPAPRESGAQQPPAQPAQPQPQPGSQTWQPSQESPASTWQPGQQDQPRQATPEGQRPPGGQRGYGTGGSHRGQPAAPRPPQPQVPQPQPQAPQPQPQAPQPQPQAAPQGGAQPGYPRRRDTPPGSSYLELQQQQAAQLQAAQQQYAQQQAAQQRAPGGYPPGASYQQVPQLPQPQRSTSAAAALAAAAAAAGTATATATATAGEQAPAETETDSEPMPTGTIVVPSAFSQAPYSAGRSTSMPGPVPGPPPGAPARQEQPNWALAAAGGRVTFAGLPASAYVAAAAQPRWAAAGQQDRASAPGAPRVVVLASTGERLLARLIDSVVVLVVTLACAMPLLLVLAHHIAKRIDKVRETAVTVKTVPLFSGIEYAYLAGVIGVLVLIGFVYETTMLGMRGHTLGKRVTGLRVVTKGSDDDITTGKAVVRSFSYYVLALIPIVNLCDMFALTWSRPYRQSWHDKIAGTMVVRV